MTIVSDELGPMFRRLEAAYVKVEAEGNAITIFALDDDDWAAFKSELDKQPVDEEALADGEPSPHYKDIPVQRWTVSGHVSSYSLEPLRSGTAGWKTLES